MTLFLTRCRRGSSAAVLLAGLMLALACFTLPTARAANGTWLNTGAVDGVWSTSSNWNSGTIPGATSGTTNADTATFSSAVGTFGTSLNPILIDANRNVQNLTFTTSAGGYFLGTTVGNALILSSAGTIQIASGLTGSNKTITINAPLSLVTGTYTFANNNTDSTNTLNFGGAISASATGTETLTLAGANTGTNTISGVISNGSATTFNLIKSGAGTWMLNGTNTYTGTTTVSSGTLQLSGTTGTLSGTSGVTVNAGGTIIDGDTATASNNDGVSNRVKSTTTLTLHAGTFQLAAADVGGIHSQSFNALSLGAGLSILNTNAATGTNTLTFSNSGTNNYLRVAGSLLNINTQEGFNVAFTNAVTTNAVGSGVDAILVGATLNNTDFVRAAAGNVGAAAYTATGMATWTAGKNMDVTGTNNFAYAAADVNSVRFHTVGGNTVTLAPGTNTVAGGILVTSNVGSNLSTITGGTLRGGSAKDLIIVQNGGATASTGLAIGSAIADNATSGLSKFGAGYLTLAGLSAIAANNYAGTTVIDQGTVALAGVNSSLSGGLTFGAAVGGTNAGNLDLSNASATFRGGLTVQTNSSTSNIITIGSGQTLTLTGGSLTNVVTVGTSTAGGVAKLKIQGAGTFTVDEATHNIVVANTDANTLSIAGATAQLDLSGLSNFNATIANLYVGRATAANGTAANGRPVTDALTLAAANTVTASGVIALGGTTNSLAGELATIYLGTTNSLNAASFVVGSARTSGTIQFNTGLANPIVTIRGATGGVSRADVYLGDQNNTRGVSNSAGGSTSITGLMDFSAGTVDAKIGSLFVGFGGGVTSNTRANGQGSFIMGASSGNSVDINSLIIGQDVSDNVGSTSTPTGTASTGTFTMNGGALQVNTAMILANDIDTTATTNSQQGVIGTFTLAGGTATIGSADTPVPLILGNHVAGGNTGLATANLTLNGGLLNVYGDIKEGTLGAGTITSALTLNGATLDLKGNNIGVSGATIDTTSFQSGTLQNVSEINGGTGLTKTGAGTLTLAGTNSFTGGITVSAGTLRLGSASALGGSSGNVSVSSGAVFDLNGTAMTNTNALTLRGTGISGGGALINSNVAAASYAGLLTLGAASSIVAGSGDIALSHTGTITGSGFGLTVGGAKNTTIASIIGTGTGTLAKQDAGTLTLTGANTYTGVTTVSNGALALDFSGAGAPVGNILAGATGSVATANTSNGALFLGLGTSTTSATLAASSGASFNLTGKAATANAQAIAGLTLNIGASHINLSPGDSGGALSIQLGNIQRLSTSNGTPGGTVDFSLPANASVTTSAGNSNGIINGWTTVNGGTWAVSAATSRSGISTSGSTLSGATLANGTQVTFTTLPTGSTNLQTGATYYVINASGSTFGLATTPGGAALTVGTSTGNGTLNSEGGLSGLASYSSSYSSGNANLDVGTGGTLSANPNSLRFNNNSAATVIANSAANGIRSIASGGILVTSNVGANTSTISGGILQGASRRDLVVIQNNTAGNLRIDSTLADIGGNAAVITKSGAGTLLLTANNVYTGSTLINEGKVIVAGGVGAGASKTGSINSGTNTLNLSDTSGLFIGEEVTNAATLAATNTTYIVTAITPNTSVTLSANASGSVTNGTFVFGGAGGLGTGSGNLVHVANGAILQIGDGGATGALVTGQNLVNGGTVAFNRSDTGLSFGNVISGAGGISQIGTGSTTLTGANTFSGDTTISAGRLILGAANVIPDGTGKGNVVMNPSSGTATFDLGGFSETINGLSNSGAGNSVVDNTSGAGSYTLTVGSNNQTGTFGGTIQNTSGTLVLTKTGTGTLTLSGDNSYTGGTTIGAGTLKVGNATALGDSTGAVSVTSGAVLDLNGMTMTNINALTLNGTGISSGGALINSSATAATYSGPITLGSDSSIVASAGDLTVSNTIGGSSKNLTLGGAYIVALSGGIGIGSGSLVKVDAGTLELNAANSFTGGVTINAGELKIGSPGALNSASGSENTVAFGLGSTGTLTLNGNSVTIANLATNSTPGTPVVQNANSTPSTLTVGNTTNQSGSFAGVVQDGIGTGALSLNKEGSGMLALSGANTFTGGISLSAGTLSLGHASALGSGTLTITGGTLDSSVVNLLNTQNNAQNWNGDFSFLGNQSLDLGTGAVTMNGSRTITVNNNTLTVGGSISGAGFGLIKSGAGTLSLTGLSSTVANNFTGTTTIGQGTLNFGNSAPSLSGGLTFGVTAGSPTVGTLDSSTASPTFSGPLLVQTNSSSPNTLTIGSGQTFTEANSVTVGLDLSGSSTNTTTKLTMNGGGAFNVEATSTDFKVGLAQASASFSNTSTLDVSALGSFAASVNNFQVGFGQTNSGTLILSNTANSITASRLDVGHSNGLNPSGTSQITLGTGTNGIQVDTINIGLSKQNGTVKFASQTVGSPGTVTITNRSGTGAANITIGSNNGTGTGATFTGVLDLRGHTAAVSANVLDIGIGSNSATGSTTGILSFDTGTFTASTIRLGSKSNGGGGTGTGTITIGGGTFTVESGGFFRMAENTAASGAAVANLNITGGTFTSNVNLTKVGGANTTANFSLSGSGTVDLTGHTLGDAAHPIDNVTLAAGTLKNVAEVNGGSGWTKTTAGTLSLDGTNTFTGGVTINDGTLQLDSSTALNSTPGSENAITFADSAPGTANLKLNGQSVTIANLSTGVTPGAPVVQNASSTAATLTVGNSTHQNGTYAGNIQDGSGGGALSLTKTGGGTLTLSGASTHTGSTTVTSGVLRLLRAVGDNSAIATDNIAATNDITIAGGTLEIAESEQIGDNASITMSSGSFSFGTATGKTETIGSFTNNGGEFSTGTNNHLIGTGNTITFAAGSTNTIGIGSSVEDAHVVISGGTNTVQAGGVLKVLSGGTGLEMAGSNLTLNSDGTVAGKLALEGNLSSTGSATITSSGNAGNPGAVDLLGGNRTVTVASGGDLAIRALVDNGALTKQGTGTLTLSGDNTYTGSTAVSQGTLLVDGDQSNATGGITVSSGSTLGGTGTIGGATAIDSGGILTAGTDGGTGTLTFSNGLTLASGATWLLDIQGANFDVISVTGDLAIAGATLSLASGNIYTQTTYIIASRAGTGTLSGGFLNYDEGAEVTPGYAIHYGLDSISLEAVPEPEAWVPALLILGLGLFFQPRRRSKLGKSRRRLS